MILQKIAESTKLRLGAMKNTGFPFESALRADGLSVIAEVKKASPSKGVIAEDFPYAEIARDYEKFGAAAISVLTEPEYFLGSAEYLREIAGIVKIPLLRKDFIVDPFQIYEAKVLGASAILLIAALLDDAKLREFFAIAESLGLSCLFEAHDERETERVLNAGARVVGVNNRDLNTFEVDLQTAVILRELVPNDRIFVAESGLKTREDFALMREIGADAVLVGETFMRDRALLKTLI